MSRAQKRRPARASRDEAVLAAQDLKARLEEILARPKVTVRDAEEALEAAQVLADLLRVEERALHLIAGETPPGDRGSADLAGLTLDEAARLVLEDEGRAMHGRELGAAIKARGWRHPRSKVARPDQIVFQLAARLPKHPDFVRVAPNTFGLRKWQEHPKPRSPKPKLPLFRGTGAGPSAAEIDEHRDAIFTDERARWRSS